MDSADREFLVQFLNATSDDLSMIFDVGGRDMPGVIVESLWPAWHAVQQRDDIGRLIAAVNSGDYDERLDGAGLSGAELAFKRAGWSNARGAGRAAPAPGPLKRWLRWIDVILGSLIAVIGAGEGLKELKEGFEAELDDIEEGA
ncbi:hypothetical protein GV794_12000 [Nocardia cyriacigeorgica]|uniref:Uncharacterized protein n=1 Tax=Nocardia cyriacigeorgica TaxID=135487 RepID=A0A6P1DE50_9NOCA|nr:hypothetical protein [Nocardia cyriacigeorgica]NEW37900.1 hypothetical protein [Nocardia cyriacigeorgica]NEW46893.1 hypothetical protein [Nocardia cyriacigeorgica]NEW48716.1 hypothetical protein [Nocardia cyriacigeorgica]NEW56369.1 hypothetical protein [Nocardia cyriacigeorgica]